MSERDDQTGWQQVGRISPSGRVRLAVWLASVFVILLATLVVRARGLWSPDELRYAQIVQGLDRVPDLFVLRLWGGIYTEKPPLYFWLVRAFTPVTAGVSLVTLLLPVVLSSCALLWLTARIATRWCGIDSAVASVIVLATLPLFVLLSSIGRMDMLLTVFVTAAVYALHRGYAERSSWMCLLGFVWMGAGFLAKGPFGIIFPLCVAGTALCLCGAGRRLCSGHTLLGSIILLAMIAGWLGPASWLAGSDFVRSLIQKQLVERAVSGLDHGEPIHFYLWIMPVMVLPWLFLLVPAVRLAWRDWRDRRDEQALWLLCWMAVPLLILSLVREKLPVYLLPTMPPVAVLVGRYWRSIAAGARLSPRFQLRVRGFFVVGALLGSCSLAASAMVRTAPDGLKEFGSWLSVSPRAEIGCLMLEPATLALGGSLILMLACAGWLASGEIRKQRLVWTFGSFAAIAPCGHLFMVLAIMPNLDASQSWRSVALALNSAQESGDPVVAYGLRPFAAFHTDNGVIWFKRQHSLSDFIRKNGPIWCATMEDDLAELRETCTVELDPGQRYPSPSGPVLLVRLRSLEVATAAGSSGTVRE